MVTVAAALGALSELSSSGGMADRPEQVVNIAVVDAGDRVAEADVRLAGEAGS
jgi:hypothetical protein